MCRAFPQFIRVVAGSSRLEENLRVQYIIWSQKVSMDGSVVFQIDTLGREGHSFQMEGRFLDSPILFYT